MSTQQTRSSDCVVRRRIALADRISEADARDLVGALESVEGVGQATMDLTGRGLEIQYDVRQTGLDEVLDELRRKGCKPSASGRSRMKTGWYRFTDQNIRDNAGHQAHCCNKPPK